MNLNYLGGGKYHLHIYIANANVSWQLFGLGVTYLLMRLNIAGINDACSESGHGFILESYQERYGVSLFLDELMPSLSTGIESEVELNWCSVVYTSIGLLFFFNLVRRRFR